MNKLKTTSNTTKNNMRLINIKARLFAVSFTLRSSKIAIAVFVICMAILLWPNSDLLDRSGLYYIKLGSFLLALLWIFFASFLQTCFDYWQDKIVNYRCDPKRLQICLRQILEHTSKRAAFRQKITVQLFGAYLSSGSLEEAASLMEQIDAEKGKFSDGWHLMYIAYCCDYWYLVGDEGKFTSAFDYLLSKPTTGDYCRRMPYFFKQLDLKGISGKWFELNGNYRAALDSYGLNSGISEDSRFCNRGQEVAAHVRLARCWEQMGYDVLSQWAFVARYGGTLSAANIARDRLSKDDPLRVSQVSIPSPTAPTWNKGRTVQLISLFLLWMMIYWAGFFFLSTF